MRELYNSIYNLKVSDFKNLNIRKKILLYSALQKFKINTYIK
jgi:hypothetical protein